MPNVSSPRYISRLTRCRFVVARRFETKNDVAITDYTVPGEQNYDKMTIVEAALATSAASTFFPEVQIGGRKYVDGGLGSNNPVNIVWSAAQKLWAPQEDLTPNLRCLISIGTGKSTFSAIESGAFKFFTQTLVEIVTQTERTHGLFFDTHVNLLPRSGHRKYYR